MLLIKRPTVGGPQHDIYLYNTQLQFGLIASFLIFLTFFIEIWVHIWDIAPKLGMFTHGILKSRKGI